MSDQRIYTVGGTVQAGGGLYISRDVDRELLDLCSAGEFAYILTSRQLGKSSLMVRTAEQLDQEGIRSVIIDLNQIGTQVTAEGWYLGILTRIEDELMLDTDVLSWWTERGHLSVTQRMTQFFQEVLLAEVGTQVVIFVDEIDSTLSLPFTDDFYAAIRFMYNARATVTEFRRLSFVLIGVATPSDLIADPQRTPFNIGRRVDLTDFTYEEAVPLAEGLSLSPDDAKDALRSVLKWTGGHPYLTQRLCSVIAARDGDHWSETGVDSAVADAFFGEMSDQDNNLQFVRDMLTRRAHDTVSVLSTYRDIRKGKKPVPDEEQSEVKSHLKLSGVVRRDTNALVVRNPIYEKVFDERWIREHFPLNWIKRLPREWRVAIGFIVVLLIISAVAAIVTTRQAVIADEQRKVAVAAQAEAERQAVIADEQREAAVAAQAEAERQAAIADEQREAAVAAQAEAERLANIADEQEQLADEARAEAEQQALIAEEERKRAEEALVLVERQTGIADSRELAARAISMSDSQLDVALLLSVEALQKFNTMEARGSLLTSILQPEPRLIRFLTGHSALVWDVTFSPDGKTLASGSDDNTIVLWDVESGQMLGEPLRGHDDSVWSVSFSPDGKTLASGSGDDTIVLWDVESGQMLGKPLRGHSGSVWSVSFSPDGKTLVSGSSDSTIILWDVESSQMLGEPLRGHSDSVWSVSFSPDGKTLASGSSDNAIVLWDVGSGQMVGEPLRGLSAVISVSFSPDGKTLASGGNDGTIILWDVESGQMLGEPLRGHISGLRSVSFSPDGKTLASGGRDSTIILWDVESGQMLGEPLRGHGGSVRSVSFSPDGKTLASGSLDNTIIFWDVDIESWKARACGIANRNLTQSEWAQFVGDEPYRNTCPDPPKGR